MTKHLRLSAVAIGLALVAGCAHSSTTGSTAPSSPTSTAPVPPATAAPTANAAEAGGGSFVLVGRVVTMSEPPVAEALLIEDGLVAAVGTRDEVLAVAGDEVRIVELGSNVAYPGFVDAHAHWIGDRDYYGLATPANAMAAALSRGWTSISEQWVNQERIDELEQLAAADELPLRVDAYLALNFDKDFFGDWYASREPGPVEDHLRVKGLKIHLDDGSGDTINWEPADLTETIAHADEAGWQLSVHAMSSAALELLLDAYEAALGPTGPKSAPPPGRARPPGDGQAAGSPGRHGHPHGDPPRWRRRLGAA